MARGSPNAQESAPVANLLLRIYEGFKWPVSKVLQRVEKEERPEPDSTQPRLGRVVFPSGAVLRQGQRLDSPELATLRPKELVTVLEERGRRLLIESRTGLHGWVSSKTEAGEPIVSISEQKRSSVLEEDKWEKPTRFQAAFQTSKPLPLFGSTSNMKAARTERAFEKAFEQKWEKMNAGRSSSSGRDQDRVLRPPSRNRNAPPLRTDKWRPGDWKPAPIGPGKSGTSSDGVDSGNTTMGVSSSGSSGAGVFDRSEKPPGFETVPRLETPPGSRSEKPSDLDTAPHVQTPVMLTTEMDLLDLNCDVPDEQEGRIPPLPDPTTLFDSRAAPDLTQLFDSTRTDAIGLDMQWKTAPPDMISLHGIPAAPPVRRETPSRGFQAPTRGTPKRDTATVALQPKDEQEHPEFNYFEELEEIAYEDGPSDAMATDPTERGGDPAHAVWSAEYSHPVEESEATEGFTAADFGDEEEDEGQPDRPLLPDIMNLEASVTQTPAFDVPEPGTLEALAAKAAADFFTPSNATASSPLVPTSVAPSKVSNVTPLPHEARADQEFAVLAAAAMVDLGSKSCSISIAQDAQEFDESPLVGTVAPHAGHPSDAPVDLLD